MVNGNRNTIIYHYDDLNQLARVDDRVAQRTWTYTYDAGGNILSKSEYEFTQLETLNENSLISRVNYTYSDGSWGDLLVGWGDKTVTSDEIGNMLSDGTWSYTWQHGRQLDSMTNGSTTINYEYDASGMRTKKTVGNKTWNYVYNGSTLSYMTDGTNELFFSYDANGPMAVKYNGVDYYYVQNAQSDVIALVNTNGEEVVTYTYGPWGELLSTGGTMAATLGQINPYTYRGYVYDCETGLYYLQSRYYNPEMGRFINADIYASTGQGILGYNMFAYCLNNSVNMRDGTGNCSKFLGFLWKVDCKKSSCPTSKNYVNAKISFGEELLTHISQPHKNGNTASVGVVIGGTVAGMTQSTSKVISVDSSYNYALQKTKSTGASTGGGGSVGLVFTFTDANNVHDLEGESTSSGFTFCSPFGISIDYIEFSPKSNPEEICHGLSVIIAYGGEAEIHSTDNETEPSESWNLLEWLKELIYGD